MKAKKRNYYNLVEISKSTLLALVADRLKDRVLFPEKVESSRKFIESIKDNNIDPDKISQDERELKIKRDNYNHDQHVLKQGIEQGEAIGRHEEERPWKPLVR